MVFCLRKLYLLFRFALVFQQTLLQILYFMTMRKNKIEIPHSIEKYREKWYVNKTINNQIRYSVNNQINKPNQRTSNHNRNDTSQSQQNSRLNLQNKIIKFQEKILKYKDTIIMMEETIEELEKLNEQLLKQSKENRHKFDQFVRKVNDTICQKDDKIARYQRQLINYRGVQQQNSISSFQSLLQTKVAKAKSVQFQRVTNSQKILTPQDQNLKQLSKQNNYLRLQKNKTDKEIERIKKQLQQKHQLIESLSTKNSLDSLQRNESLQFYQKIIYQKQQTIRKMSQFNNEICLKLISYTITDDQNNKKLDKINGQQIMNKFQRINDGNEKYIAEIQDLKAQIKQNEKKYKQILLVIDNKDKQIQKSEEQILNLKAFIIINKVNLNNQSQFDMVESHMVESDSKAQCQAKLMEEQIQIYRVQMQKMSDQLLYWKNKSKGLWQLLKNIENQNYFEHPQKQLLRNNSTLLRNSSLIGLKQATSSKRPSMGCSKNNQIMKFINPKNEITLNKCKIQYQQAELDKSEFQVQSLILPSKGSYIISKNQKNSQKDEIQQTYEDLRVPKLIVRRSRQDQSNKHNKNQNKLKSRGKSKEMHHGNLLTSRGIKNQSKGHLSPLKTSNCYN